MASRVERGIIRREKEKKTFIILGFLILFISVTIISYMASMNQIKEMNANSNKVDASQLVREMVERNKKDEHK